MSTSVVNQQIPCAQNIKVTEDTLSVDLEDGRTISVPLAWFPRLVHATAEERNTWRLIGNGEGIHWKSLDEDISVEGLLSGHASGESQISFKKWLEKRNALQK
ncbi:MAG: DUF2442 domain-containing protein [Nitrospira sp.]|nr:DUF2442 domain-containing protein [Nitrospira sp.]MCB9710436.1 DUF2442 domain-containing protein [Nitrospiraceae bacterium]